MTAETALYKKTVLPHGLRIITEAIPHVRSVSMGVWINVGSRDENDSSSGVSHFIEHMVFKGTKNRNASEIASYLESVGGVLNAFTSREQTCFYAKFLDEQLSKATEILFDLINNALFDPNEIEKEKKVVLEELKDIEDSPSDIIHDLFASALFGKHPLGRSIMGNRTTINNIKKRHILGYVGKFYRPDRIIVSASGNLVHEKLVEEVLKHYDPSQIDQSSNGRRKPVFKPVQKVHYKKIKQTHVCLGVQARDFNHNSRSAMSLLNSIMGGGMSSRLFQEIRENLGLAYSIFSYLDYFEDTGVFGIYLGTDKKNVKKALLAVRKKINEAMENKLPQDELERAKEQLKGNLMLGLENTSNRMNRLAKHELLAGRYISLDETVSSIDAVTSEGIAEVANDMFSKKDFTIVTLGPVENNIYKALD